MRFIQHITKQIQCWIAPPSKACIACGRQCSLHNKYTHLCFSCVRALPWIHTIRCPSCGKGTGCTDCTNFPHTRAFICNRSAVQYTDVMKQYLAAYKYRGDQRYAPLFIGMVHQAYRALYFEHNAKIRTRWRIHACTFVPISPQRMAERGFNQAQVFAQGIAKRQRIPLLSLLLRNQHTPKQSSQNKRDRMHNMSGAFSSTPHSSKQLTSLWKKQKFIHPFRLLLLDDIYTTGSTLQACSIVLIDQAQSLSLPMEVYTLTWAR